ncbi:MAG: rod shape-determining protein MreC [Phycisphaerae bacterium]
MSVLQRITRGHVLAALLVLAAATAFVGRPAASMLRNSVQWAFAVGGDAGMYLTTFVKSKAGGGQRVTPAQYRQVQKEADHYRLLYQKSLQSIQDLKRQFQQMRSLFGVLQTESFRAELIEGRIIAADSLPYGRFRSINIGTNRGAQVGSHVTSQVVLTPNAKALPDNLAVVHRQRLIGRVVEAWAFGARIQLLTDRGFSLPVRIWRDLAHARKILDVQQAQVVDLDKNSPLIDVRMTGDGAMGIDIEDVPQGHNILPGDWVLTRQDRHFLPARVPVAQVTAVEKQVENPGFVRIKAKPLVDLESLRDVIIVLPLSQPSLPVE